MELTWLLCNKCFVHLKESKCPFSLTQCGHLFCRKCISKIGSKCPVCKTNGVQSLCLTTPLQPMVSPLFEDLLSMAEKLVMAAKFQKFQLLVMEQRENELAKKYMALKSTYWALMEDFKKISANYNAMKAEYEDIIRQRDRGPPLFQDPSRSPVVTFAPQPIVFADNRSSHNCNMFRSGDTSDDSDTSSSTVRGLRTSRTPDGVFRIPTTTRVPRSTGTTTPNSGGSTPMSVDYVQRKTGYVSDSNGYYRR